MSSTVLHNYKTAWEQGKLHIDQFNLLTQLFLLLLWHQSRE